MGVAMGSIGTGLPKNIVKDLINAEREPVRRLEASKQKESSKLNLLKDIKDKTTKLQTNTSGVNSFQSFRDLTTAIGKPDLLDATVDKLKAEPADYQIEVVQMAQKASMISNGFSDPDKDEVGVGYFKYYTADGSSKSVWINSNDNSLRGVAKLINAQTDSGLYAYVVNDGKGEDEPWRLVVAKKSTGEENSVEWPYFYFVDGDYPFYMDNEREAKNAKIKLDGFEIEFAENQIKDLIPGVTLTLKEAAPGKEFTFSVKADIKSIKGKVKAFVDSMNDVLKFITQQNTLSKDSDTSQTLGGDITLQNLESNMRRLVQTTYTTSSGHRIRLSDIGIQFQKDGSLAMNEQKVEKALERQFTDTAELFAGWRDGSDQFDGLAQDIEKIVRGFTLPGTGILATREAGIKARVENIQRQISFQEAGLERKEKVLRDKFSRLEATMQQLKSQQAYLQQAGLGGGGLLGGFDLGTVNTGK